MRNLFLLLVSITLVLACKDSAKEAVAVADEEIAPIAANSDWAINHLKGKVKSIEESHYTPDSLGSISAMDSCCTEVEVHNENGFVVKYYETDSDGTVTEETVIEYVEGDEFKSARTTIDGKEVFVRVANYDADGKLLDATDTDSTGQITYYYDNMIENEIGQILSGKMYSADSTFMGTWTRKYTDGMETGRGWSDQDGNVLDDTTGELNEKGWLAKMTTVNTDAKGVSTTTVETMVYDSFDEMGNWTQRTEFDNDGKTEQVEKRVYTYFE